MRINIDLTHIRDVVLPAFHEALFNENRVQVLRGGRSSGKSYFWAQKVIFRVLLDYNKIKHIFVVLRKSSSNCDRSIVKQLQQVIDDWGVNKLVQYNKTSKIFKFSNGAEVMCTGLDDPLKIKGVFGVTGIVCDEATELTYQDFVSIDLSMRGKTNTYLQTILAFNPISITNWVYENFFMRKPKGVFYHHSTFRDNTYNSIDYRDRIETLVGQNKNMYNILCEGQWGILEGIIYDNYEVVDGWPEEIEGDTVYGLDPGYNHNYAMVRVAQYKDGYILDELFYETGKTTGDLIEVLPDLVGNKNDYMYCDSARPDNIEEIFREGYNIYSAIKGPGSVKESIDYLKRFKLYVTDRSTNLLKELQTYSWKQTKDGKYLDEPVKQFDDLADAFRYAIYSHFTKPKRCFDVYV